MIPKLRDIEAVVCQYFHLTHDEFISILREPRVARPRQIAMLLAREQTMLSLPQIGRWLCRDHSTICHGIERIRELEKTNPKIATYVADCRAALETLCQR